MDRWFEIQCPPFNLKLSHWDTILPHWGSCTSDVQDLSDTLSFDRLVEENFSQRSLAEEFYSSPKVIDVEDNTADVCRFQANFIDGGLLLVVSIIHIVADGRGVTEIVKIFAENFRKAQSGLLGYPLETTKELYHSDRTEIITGNGIPGSIEAHAAWTSTAANTHSQPVDIETSCPSPNSWISTNDAISAFIWRSIMVARHRAGFLDADKEVHIAQPVDCRALLGLDELYFGNAIYMTQGSLPFSDLADPATGLSAAAQTIRAQIQTATAEQFRDLVGYAERTGQEKQTRMRIIDEVLTGGIILTSHFKFGLHAVDFGPAFEGRHVKALRFPARATMVGAVIVLPKLLDGSCEFMITEQERTMDCLSDDGIFCRFAAENKKMAKSALLDPHLLPSPPCSDHDVKADSDALTSAEIPATTNLEDRFSTTTPSVLNVITMQAAHIGTIKVIEMNRPRANSAISLQMLHQLNEEVERIHHERTVGAHGYE
ncbi:transferase family protein [Hirsutella rhossiliensis]|uniref:Transferase family domain-containing protein n=1 Tax=Hirsutella rhossiliensis TaxID=111463 RepID=A0A9P8MZ77_9HYPO|nr:transferase family domain-containing protein [Hirsutella rhossiliensis]KAH0961812.1 transferase family domain-containing protein [Hirsutella rhossiliensis]